MKKPAVNKITLSLLASGVSLVALSFEALAQDDAPADGAEIITVQARSFRDPSDETATKLAIPLAETAGQVLVLTEDLYDALGNVSLQDALNFIPGVTDNELGSGQAPRLISRGFGLSQRNGYRVNGAPLGSSLTFDQVAIGRLEFIKGSQSSAYGQISAGGFINVALKKGNADAWSGDALIQADNWGRIRGEAGYGGPVNKSGTIRAFGAVSRGA
ncbi:MAG: TonB-dependent receptor plug domain-containing protein [Pseudomonadota bacterium]